MTLPETYISKLRNTPRDQWPIWLKRRANLFDKIVSNEQFRRDVEAIRSKVVSDILDEPFITVVKSLMQRYRLLPGMERVVDTYLETGVVDYMKIEPPIRYFSNEKKMYGPSVTPEQTYQLVVKDKDRALDTTLTGLVIQIVPGTSKGDIKSFIDFFWDEQLEPTLGASRRVRINARDAEVLDLALAGKESADIAAELDMEVTSVRRTLKRIMPNMSFNADDIVDVQSMRKAMTKMFDPHKDT